MKIITPLLCSIITPSVIMFILLSLLSYSVSTVANPNNIIDAVHEVIQSRARIGSLVAISGLISFPGIAQVRVYTVTSTSSDTYRYDLQPKEILLRFEEVFGWSIDSVRNIAEWKHFSTMPTEEDSTEFINFLQIAIAMNIVYNDADVSGKEYERFIFTQFHPGEFGMHSFNDDIFSPRMKVLLRAIPARHIAAFCSVMCRRLYPIIWFSRIEIDFTFGSDGLHSFWSEMVSKRTLDDPGTVWRAIVHYKRFRVPPPTCINEAFDSVLRNRRRYRKHSSQKSTHDFKIISIQRSEFILRDSAPLLE